MRLKVFFVMRSGAHFPYHVTTIDHLRRRGHDVTLFLDPDWHGRGRIQPRALDAWLEQAGPVQVRDAVPRTGWWRAVLTASREARSYANYCQRGPAVEFYRTRWKRYLPGWLRPFTNTALGGWLFRRRLTGQALAAVERLAPADRAIVESLRRETPDCVVASPTNMRFDAEVEYIKAAKALGVPCVVPVLSWDNLTTKGLLPVPPDLVLAWHKGHARDAREIHGIPGSRALVTGAPFFDKWFDGAATIPSRSAICQRVGLDPARPYVLYLGSSVSIAKDESWLLIALVQALRASRNPELRRLQVIFRPHPNNQRAVRQLDRAKVPVWPREPGLPDTTEMIAEFRAMLHHAIAAVGINTTGMLDAILCDRPCVAITAEEYKATQIDTDHFQRMLQSKALYVAHSIDDAVPVLRRLANGQDARGTARRAFMKTYARPRGLGADAGEAAALAIEHVAARRPLAELPAVLDRELSGRPDPAPPAVEPEPRRAASQQVLRTIEKARKTAIFRHYLRVRDLILRMLDDEPGYASSAYWKQELRGFEYLFDASPLVIAKLREHTYHITGLRSYEYRHHHAGRASPFADKLRQLKAHDPSNLFVGEAPHLGGFGHRIDEELVNLDTLKFYECLIALDRAGVVSQLRSPDRRHRVLEIGAGWGGFAYQLKTLFPRTTYLIVDLPATMLFSATYLKATFPDARMRFYGEGPDEDLLNDVNKADFVFIPAHAFARLPIPAVDLAVNIASFQEMTTAQVTGYVQKLDESGCPVLYSLNRDRSPYNRELSTVTEIVETAYAVEPIEVLEYPYTVLSWKPGRVFERSPMDYRHQVGRRRRAN